MGVKQYIVRTVGFGLLLTLVGAPRPTAAGDEAMASSKISTRVTPEGEVIVQVKVAAKVQAVRDVLASAERTHYLAPTTLSSHATPDGSCERVKLKVRGLIGPFQLETRRCPTAKGYIETLIASTDFVEYRSEWVFKDLGVEGTQVIFKTRTVPNVQVPKSLILIETKRVLTRLLMNLLDALERRAEAVE